MVTVTDEPTPLPGFPAPLTPDLVTTHQHAGRPVLPLSAAKVKRVRELLAEGLPIQATADYTGVSRQHITRAIAAARREGHGELATDLADEELVRRGRIWAKGIAEHLLELVRLAKTARSPRIAIAMHARLEERGGWTVDDGQDVMQQVNAYIVELIGPANSEQMKELSDGSSGTPGDGATE